MQINWNPIRLEYIRSQKSMEEVAKQFDVDSSGLKQRAKDENWVKERAGFQLKVRQDSTEKAQKQAVETLVQKNERRSKIWRNIAVMTTRRLNADTKLFEKLNKEDTTVEEKTKIIHALIDTKAFKDLAEIFKISCLGERLEDGQPTSISKNENDNRNLSITDVLKELNKKYGSPDKGKKDEQSHKATGTPPRNLQLNSYKNLSQEFLKIVNKAGQTVPFIYNQVQQTFQAEKQGWDIILKPRQKGFTTMIQGEFFLDCLMFDNVNAVTISYKDSDTQIILEKCKYFKNTLELPIDVKYDNRSTLYFPQTNSKMRILTAGAKIGGRGDTINRLHCSEIAFWSKVGIRTVDDFMSGILQSVPMNGSKVYLETTANGIGGYFFDTWKNPVQYKKHFYPWFFDDEYQLSNEKIKELYPTGYAPSVEYKTSDTAKQYGLTINQQAWRDFKINSEKGRVDKFLQEYPEDDITCFRESAQSVFRSKDLKLSGIQEERGTPRELYFVVVDPAEGNPDSDDSAIVVINLNKNTICKALKGKWSPDITSRKAVEQARLFNNAKITVERNNHGHAVIMNILRIQNYTYLYIHTDGKHGWLTTSGNKTTVIDDFEQGIRTGELKIACQDVLNQASDMRYNEKGDIISTNEKHHYDLIMAGSIGWHTRKGRGLKIR